MFFMDMDKINDKFNKDKTDNNQIDSRNDCLISAGETYCESLQKCIKPWVEECPVGDTGE